MSKLATGKTISESLLSVLLDSKLTHRYLVRAMYYRRVLPHLTPGETERVYKRAPSLFMYM